jgi:hypothetical protein
MVEHRDEASVVRRGSSSNFLAVAFWCYVRCPCFYSSMQFPMTNATEVELRQHALADGATNLNAIEILAF